MSLCDCDGRRIPNRFKLSFAGIANRACSDCANLDGDYYLDRVGSSCTVFSLSLSGAACGLRDLYLYLEDKGNGKFGISIYTTGDTWNYLSQTDIPDLLAGPITCVRNGDTGTACVSPASITVEAIGPAISQLAAATCLAAPVDNLIPPYSGPPCTPDRVAAFLVPSAWPALPTAIGPPAALCSAEIDAIPPSGAPSPFQGVDAPTAGSAPGQPRHGSFHPAPQLGASSGPPDALAAQLGPPQLLPPPPQVMTLAGPIPAAEGAPVSIGDCGAGSGSSAGGECGCGTASGPSPSPAAGTGQAFGTPVRAALPREWPAPARVDLAYGSVQFQIGPPVAGMLDPTTVFTYNSRYANATENGRGVVGSYHAKLTELDSTSVELLTATGERLTYLYKNGSGVYLAPPGGNQLVKNFDAT